MWGGEESLETTALRMRQKFPDFWEFVISLYSSVTDNVKLLSQRLFATMAVSVSYSSSSQNSEDGFCYAITAIGLSDLQLKNEQNFLEKLLVTLFSGTLT